MTRTLSARALSATLLALALLVFSPAAAASTGDVGADEEEGAYADARAGDPVHGVDIKLGVARAGDPVHGVDIKLGAKCQPVGGACVGGAGAQLSSSPKGTGARASAVGVGVGV